MRGTPRSPMREAHRPEVHLPPQAPAFLNHRVTEQLIRPVPFPLSSALQINRCTLRIALWLGRRIRSLSQ